MQLTIFDEIRSQQAKQHGISVAEGNRLAGVELARVIAKEIAAKQGTLTADDVAMEFQKRGIPWIGCAAGAIFAIRKDWEWTGEFKYSARVEAHRNLLRVWRLK